MRDFVLDQPGGRVVFGAGSLDAVPGEVRALGAERVMLVGDRHSRTIADTIAARLPGQVVARIGHTATHVPEDLAADAVRLARESGADLLVCVGGGSATGLAKAVALSTRLRILAVPTTYAGSEMTPIWGLTGDGRKRTGRDPAVRPVCVVYDPVLTLGLPPALSAASGMNAMAHLVEAVYAPKVSPLTVTAAVEGAGALARALPGVVRDPADLAARDEALYGAWLAGWVLGTTTTGIHHKVCHVLGGRYGLPHAATHSAVLPYATAHNREAAGPSLAPLARALGAEDAAAGLWDLAVSVGAPTSLAAVGMKERDLDEAAALVVAERPVNPRAVDVAGVLDLLRAAYAGARPSQESNEVTP